MTVIVVPQPPLQSVISIHDGRFDVIKGEVHLVQNLPLHGSTRTLITGRDNAFPTGPNGGPMTYHAPDYSNNYVWGGYSTPRQKDSAHGWAGHDDVRLIKVKTWQHMCLDFRGSGSSGAKPSSENPPAYLWSCWDNVARWQLEGDGLLRWIPGNNNNYSAQGTPALSDWCLGAAFLGHDSPIELQRCGEAGNAQQSWQVVGGETLRLMHRPNLCLDRGNSGAGKIPENSNRVMLWECSGWPQTWLVFGDVVHVGTSSIFTGAQDRPRAQIQNFLPSTVAAIADEGILPSEENAVQLSSVWN